MTEETMQRLVEPEQSLPILFVAAQHRIDQFDTANPEGAGWTSAQS